MSAVGRERLLAQMIVADRDRARVLLGFHKSGRWAGFYTGFLDEVRGGEDPVDAAVRIAGEQAGIVPGPFDHLATFVFSSEAWGMARELEFLAESHTGEPRESPNIRPEWFALDAIPFDRMPADDALWYPDVLERKKMRGHFDFAPDGKTLLVHQIEELGPGETP